MRLIYKASEWVTLTGALTLIIQSPANQTPPAEEVRQWRAATRLFLDPRTRNQRIANTSGLRAG